MAGNPARVFLPVAVKIQPSPPLQMSLNINNQWIEQNNWSTHYNTQFYVLLTGEKHDLRKRQMLTVNKVYRRRY